MFNRYSIFPGIWQFDILAIENDIRHFISGREGGVTSGQLGSFNLSFKVGDDPDNVEENRIRLAKYLNISSGKLIFPVQTHSLNVRLVKTGMEDLEETDALISDQKGICIAVMSADCVPVLLYDPVKKSCAAIHSGWKGTVGKIVEKTIKEMNNQFGTDPSDLIACIGPSICPDVYEVGAEVIIEIENAFGATEGIIAKGKDGKGLFNLWESNRLQLVSAGVKEKNIVIAGVCTYLNSDQFFSARKSKNNTGRFAAGIMLL